MSNPAPAPPQRRSLGAEARPDPDTIASCAGRPRSASSASAPQGRVAGARGPSPPRAAEVDVDADASASAPFTPPPPLTSSLPASRLTALAEVAERVADAAGGVARRHFRTRVAVDVKADASPVTVADREAELAMRAVLATSCPSHAVFGEEGGYSGNDCAVDAETGVPEFLWVLDPIDGTKSFVTGKPLFGCLVALLHRGRPIIGIVDAPALGERWVGIAGRATRHGRAPVSSRACPKVQDAYLYATSPHMFDDSSAAAFERLREATRLAQYGCDCYAYALLACGFVDLVAEADMKPYDVMALVPVVAGAGGALTDWAGRPIEWIPEPGTRWKPEAEARTVLAAGDPALHAEALWLLDWDGR